ncbi:peptidoglycan DD-metalloendopeptidase family protein [Burkholderia multivorans]|uniref:peptidoglycan DD-metalloendopeptidase family protein n=1 Tax=Burkholderia multivorans TaxID=87883 RepID=UPI00207D56C5|nr:peptidoglycan DD-metalloendopeptidase family protein [Burkholderia multivorans]MCO1461766.1 peptidoglycan DD-metalloendopeptidase family protein [Burkholderia multivorans]
MFGTTTKRLIAAGCAALLVACGSAPVGPGFYRVERGDTLYKIARANRQSVQNIVRWNQISNPDAIEVGQVLRVAPPPGTTTASTTGTGTAGRSRPAPSAPVESAVKPATSISLVWPAPGVVVYAGNGLRGYGNLIILKHNADYLTAYAHNRALLVKEGQSVAQGQTIAEMGDSDSDRVALHFELRYGGRSIDPARYLPAR